MGPGVCATWAYKALTAKFIHSNTDTVVERNKSNATQVLTTSEIQ